MFVFISLEVDLQNEFEFSVEMEVTQKRAKQNLLVVQIITLAKQDSTISKTELKIIFRA